MEIITQIPHECIFGKKKKKDNYMHIFCNMNK